MMEEESRLLLTPKEEKQQKAVKIKYWGWIGGGLAVVSIVVVVIFSINTSNDSRGIRSSSYPNIPNATCPLKKSTPVICIWNS